MTQLLPRIPWCRRQPLSSRLFRTSWNLDNLADSLTKTGVMSIKSPYYVHRTMGSFLKVSGSREFSPSTKTKAPTIRFVEISRETLQSDRNLP